jgi:hypothetical protein
LIHPLNKAHLISLALNSCKTRAKYSVSYFEVLINIPVGQNGQGL